MINIGAQTQIIFGRKWSRFLTVNLSGRRMITAHQAERWNVSLVGHFAGLDLANGA